MSPTLQPRYATAPRGRACAGAIGSGPAAGPAVDSNRLALAGIARGLLPKQFGVLH
jgi:hypothetical protein